MQEQYVRFEKMAHVPTVTGKHCPVLTVPPSISDIASSRPRARPPSPHPSCVRALHAQGMHACMHDFAASTTRTSHLPSVVSSAGVVHVTKSVRACMATETPAVKGTAIAFA